MVAGVRLTLQRRLQPMCDIRSLEGQGSGIGILGPLGLGLVGSLRYRVFSVLGSSEYPVPTNGSYTLTHLRLAGGSWKFGS